VAERKWNFVAGVRRDEALPVLAHGVLGRLIGGRGVAVE
jgi:hypothetical protein